jgi:polyisoprenoid-binding protein YceI
MKKIVFTVLLLSTFGGAFAQKYMTRTGKVTFYSATPIEKIEAFNNEVANILNGQTGDILFSVPIKSFKFEKQTMQEHFNEDYMESDKFPKSEFKGKITNISEVNFTKDGVYKTKADGKLTIHGVTQTVSIPGTITVKGAEVTANSKFMVKAKDYEIKIPSLVADKIAKEIEITVNSVLTAVH